MAGQLRSRISILMKKGISLYNVKLVLTYSVRIHQSSRFILGHSQKKVDLHYRVLEGGLSNAELGRHWKTDVLLDNSNIHSPPTSIIENLLVDAQCPWPMGMRFSSSF